MWLAALNPTALAIVTRVELGGQLGRERMFFNVPMAVAQYVERARAAGPMSATVTAS